MTTVIEHCDVRECVNPEHLYSGDYLSNRSDMLIRKRWSHPWALREACEKGHNYEQGGYRIASVNVNTSAPTAQQEKETEMSNAEYRKVRSAQA